MHMLDDPVAKAEAYMARHGDMMCVHAFMAVLAAVVAGLGLQWACWPLTCAGVASAVLSTLCFVDAQGRRREASRAYEWRIARGRIPGPGQAQAAMTEETDGKVVPWKSS